MSGVQGCNRRKSRRKGALIVASTCAAAAASRVGSLLFVCQGSPQRLGRHGEDVIARHASGLRGFIDDALATFDPSNTPKSEQEADVEREEDDSGEAFPDGYGSRPLGDVKVGDVVDGKVASLPSVFSCLARIEIGCDRHAHLLAPKHQALEKLELDQEIKGLKVVKTSGNPQPRVLLSAPGFDKLRMLEDFKVGEVVSGEVVSVTQNHLSVDIGAERIAQLNPSKKRLKKAARKLKPEEKLDGLKVVNVTDRSVTLSFDGILEQVAGRRDHKWPGWKKTKRRDEKKARIKPQQPAQAVAGDPSVIAESWLDMYNQHGKSKDPKALKKSLQAIKQLELSVDQQKEQMAKEMQRVTRTLAKIQKVRAETEEAMKT